MVSGLAFQVVSVLSQASPVNLPLALTSSSLFSLPPCLLIRTPSLGIAATKVVIPGLSQVSK